MAMKNPLDKKNYTRDEEFSPSGEDKGGGKKYNPEDKYTQHTKDAANRARAQATIDPEKLKEMHFDSNKDSPSTNMAGSSNVGKIQSLFAGSLATSGGLFNQEINYDIAYNALHRLDYFDPNTNSGIHIFITRPFLNLCPANLAMSQRMMQAGLTQKGCILLAQLMYPGKYDDIKTDAKNEYTNAGLQFDNIKTHGVDLLGYTPFMPRLSNLSFSISGLKDLIMEKYDYDGDRAGNKTSDAMGTQESESQSEITINYYEDSVGSIVNMHTFWMEYIDAVGYGTMNPTEVIMEELEYDYMSSLFFFVTGQDGMSIKMYGECTGLFPLNSPTQALIPPERGSFTDPKISINYHVNHLRLNHPGVLNRFNRLVFDSWALSGDAGLVNPPGFRRGVYPRPFNNSGMLRTWLGNEFNAAKGKDNSRGGADNLKKDDLRAGAQGKYNKYLGGNGSFGPAGNMIFSPEPQVAWEGHPFIIAGKLVYMDLGKKLSENYKLYSQRNEPSSGYARTADGSSGLSTAHTSAGAEWSWDGVELGEEELGIKPIGETGLKRNNR